MWSTYIDPYDLFTKLGPEIRFLPYSTYGEMIDVVSDEELQAYCGELTSRYKMMDDVARDKFEASVRASIGLQKMAERSDIDVMVFNDIDRAMFELVGLRAGFYHPWFNDNCSVLVPEADIGAGLITYLLKLISGKNVNFLEPFHIESDYGTFAGRPCRSQRPQRPRLQQNVVIARDVRFAKTSYKYAGVRSPGTASRRGARQWRSWWSATDATSWSPRWSIRSKAITSWPPIRTASSARWFPSSGSSKRS